MDIVHDDHRHLFPQKHMQLSSAPVSPTYFREYDGDIGTSMPTKPHLDEEKLSKLSDKSQDPVDGNKPSKKPRQRHSAAQLAALNGLFEKSEHPSLDQRVELAEKLGMETKTVNAWFQNKRASTKKRNKGGPSEQTPATSHGDTLEDPLKASSPSALPSIANLLNDPPTSLASTQLNAPQSTPARPHISSRRPKRKDLHSGDLLPNSESPVANPHQSDQPREGILESSFFAGPPEFFSVQDRFVSHHRGPDAEDGAVPPLLNADADRFPPDTDGRFVSENDGAADGHPSRRAKTESTRMRTTTKQAEELRRAYAISQHPSRDQRQQLADRIGMRLQSVTNWFQNQRSQAKKHKDEPRSVPASSPVTADVSANREHQPPLRNKHGGPQAVLQWQRSAVSSRARRPSLTMPEKTVLPLQGFSSSSAVEPLTRMSLPPSSPRTRRSVTPYARDTYMQPDVSGAMDGVRAEDILARNRRSRPQPHQLQALKKLLRRTSTPSIEERTSLAFEIGMDVGRVTNWFRNIRQTARRRGKQVRAGSLSRSQPRDRSEHDSSSGSSAYDDDDAMDLDYEDLIDHEMDDWSEEECQEAVTPSSGVSLSPPPAKRSRPPIPVHRGMGGMGVESMGVGLIEPGAFQELEKAVATVGGSSDYALDPGMNTAIHNGVKVEDALLLLSFHQHVVQ
ncbi:hypothetical protein ID866_6755 [Astraeus odoratus]|nr:hypothetical protein ID866_6755 [Astraeus odoratus]